MGGRGSATSQGGALATPNPLPQTPTGLADDADSATIQSYYKDNLGIDVGGSYFRDSLDTKLLTRASQVLDNLVQELGKDIFDEMKIRIVSSTSQFKGSKGARAYAQTSLGSGAISVNPNFFDDYNKVRAQIHNDVASGFHPKGSKAADVIVHELGHNLEFLINKRNNNFGRTAADHVNMLLADVNQSYAKAIVQSAYAELKKEQPSLFSTEKQARRSISGYADSKWNGAIAYTECFAEAVADYGRNGKNANPFSLKIWEGIKEALK